MSHAVTLCFEHSNHMHLVRGDVAFDDCCTHAPFDVAFDDFCIRCERFLHSILESRTRFVWFMGFRAAHLSSNDRSRSAIPPSALPWQLVVRTPRTCHPWMSSNQVAHVMCSGRFELEIPTGWSSGLFSVWSSCWVVSFRTCLRNILDSCG